MALQQFVDRHLGNKVDFDGAFGAQCVDLVRQFIQEELQVPQPEPTGSEGAWAFFSRHHERPVQRAHFNLAEYSGIVRPSAGAILVFRPAGANRFGHVAICVRSDHNGMDVFEQDGFRHDGAKMGRWNYDRLAGWLVKK